ncbi:chemotaxis protein CheY [Curtobacterium flaccumfaciens pv. flaccumfaciens]|uniref:chemotaxis protein CheY n=1 Tax=Curtobacterium flaccumfaciens TaxID=2035 RepID=UPI001ADA1151|nr:chemotaxis protein CheY [Curtobacterium flaccumfaciens]MBO9048773.1 chemotaxis protein CheY [Curtobacterium flaccumfaciens pv. flaccumfaciens]MBO9058199.1 chemotaxis protein CheY [Curtobacterium flaccumfaciens pv. flaccumfaciens]QTR90008.1 chemotaxis protein CheY [Curtobacterium flaccumfaciens pv. flaccumfaciens]
MDDTTARPGPAEAARLLDQADRIGRRAHDAVRWPYVTFITALGVATSLGTLGMGLTTGDAFAAVYVGTLVALFALVVFFVLSIRGRSAFARSRRWTVYIASWAVTYLAAIAVVGWVHGSVLWSGITSGLVLLVALVCAAREARS